MIALDTNLLVNAHRVATSLNVDARHALSDAAARADAWGDRRPFTRLACRLEVAGARIFDLQIGLTALEAGASELWTHDRSFVAIPGLRVHDPMP